MAGTPTPPKLPDEVYTIFCGGIEQATAQKIVNSLTAASVNHVKHVHILFQSAGGFVGDGIFLYNLFRAVPIELTLYNVGQLSSAAVVAYLGAKRRKTSTRATFMIHRSTNTTQFATSSRLEHITKSLILDDERTESILHEHVKLSDELWNELRFHDIYLSGKEAVDSGMATEIGEFEPPAGVQVFNLLG
jgi:ATP-dependent Clp protease protease subunit